LINSIEFWLTLAVAVCVYWLIPARFRLAFLAAVSAAYVTFLDPVSAGVLLASSLLIKWIFDREIGSSRASLLIKFIVVGLILVLAGFKALPNLLMVAFESSLLQGVAVPLGISYYTFKLIHYGVERNRGRFKDVGIAEFFTWLFLFPIFTAGPIELLDHFQKSRSQEFDHDLFYEGVGRIFIGMIKKFVIVGLVLQFFLMDGETSASMYKQLGTVGVLELWIFFVFLFLSFYLEFSAYSDIAIGASRLFGITIIENFNWPILAKNMSEFWRRWHMSLSGWCQRYVYMPVIARTRNPYYAIFFTFLTIGMWHAVDFNYLSWGLYHGMGVAIAVTWGRIRKKMGWLNIEKGIFVYWGLPFTLAYVSFGGIFSSTTGMGYEPVIAFAAKLLGFS
jgi:alginate O-acetyltransferase complex protein AlgI